MAFYSGFFFFLFLNNMSLFTILSCKILRFCVVQHLDSVLFRPLLINSICNVYFLPYLIHNAHKQSSISCIVMNILKDHSQRATLQLESPECFKSDRFEEIKYLFQSAKILKARRFFGITILFRPSFPFSDKVDFTFHFYAV